MHRIITAALDRTTVPGLGAGGARSDDRRGRRRAPRSAQRLRSRHPRRATGSLGDELAPRDRTPRPCVRSRPDARRVPGRRRTRARRSTSTAVPPRTRWLISSGGCRRWCPGIEIAGTSPSTFATSTPDELDAMAATIRASGASICFVGLGCPRQEVFVYENADRLRMPLPRRRGGVRLPRRAPARAGRLDPTGRTPVAPTLAGRPAASLASLPRPESALRAAGRRNSGSAATDRRSRLPPDVRPPHIGAS